MKPLIALEIPDDPIGQSAWLERQLVGLDLATLVAELEAVHGPPTGSGPTLAGTLGDRLETVLASGLADLPPLTLGRLLRHPRLLLELQEKVLTKGGDHWGRIDPGADLGQRVDRGRDRLNSWLAGKNRRSSSNPDRPASPTIAWHRRPGLVALVTAASILAAVVAFEQTRPTAPTGWGWDRPGDLPEAVSSAIYFARLADDAEEWFHERPSDALALAHRIADFRRGCSTLILADHRPLSAPDRSWLVEKCRGWAGRLDAHLAAIEAGQPMTTVRAEVDVTVRKLIAALRERASTGA